MVQWRGARFTTRRYRNTSSVSEMLEHLNWETLESRLTKSSLTVFYKVVNNLVDIPASTYLTPGSSRTRSSHSLKFRQFQCSLNSFKYSFFPATVVTWNSLPASVAEALTWHLSSEGYLLSHSRYHYQYPLLDPWEHYWLRYALRLFGCQAGLLGRGESSDIYLF